MPERLQIALELPQRAFTCTGLEQMAVAAVYRSLISAVLPAWGAAGMRPCAGVPC
jgi:hypothetical protein